MISPLLRHGLESFEHGLEHYIDKSERSRKFAILHIDQAIELFLKERVIQAGKTVYKTDGTTLSIHEAFNSLKDVCKIQERPRLEELHDIRNIIQHKGFSPDEGATKFYIEIAYAFIKRFLLTELNLPIEEVLSKQNISLMEGNADKQETPTEISISFEHVKSAETPLNKILLAYTLLERAVTILPQEISPKGKPKQKATLLNAVIANGIAREEFESNFKFIMALRGQILAKNYEPTERDAQKFLACIAKILDYVGVHENQSQ